MKLRNSLISFVLIFAYSIGFAHNFVPHCTELHLNGDHTQAEHHDKHHVHEKGEIIADDHTHIAHSDHFDDGILDLILCALEDANHHEGTCTVDCSEPITKFSTFENEIDKLDIEFDTSLPNFELVLSSEIANYSDAENNRATEGLIVNYSYRGPPIHTS